MQRGELRVPLLEDAKNEEPNTHGSTALAIAPARNGSSVLDDEYSTKKVLKEILMSTSLFGIRGLVVAMHYAGNGLIMSSLGGTAAAASSMAATLQGVTIAFSSGFLTATGIDLASALGKRRDARDDVAVGSVMKTSWAMVLLFSILTMSALNSTKGTLPLFLAPDVAEAASQYLQFFSIAVIPDLLILNNGLVIFQIEKNSWMPFFINASYRMPALALSYYLGSVLGLGPMGVGLGSAISGWVNILAFQPWFSKAVYQKYNLYSPNIPEFRKHAKKFLSSGWKLSLQRISEWGNLAALTAIIGAWSSQGLIAVQPSVLLINLCGLLSQGFGQASMMTATRDCKEMKKALEDFEKTEDHSLLLKAKHIQNKNRKNFYISNISGVTFNLLLAGTVYLSRQTILDWYVPDDTPNSTLALAETLLWINDISAVFDAVRIISGGILRGWGDLIIPTLASLLIMSGLGIPGGLAWGIETDESISPFFILRAITLLLAGAFNCYRFTKHIHADQKSYEAALLFDQLNSAIKACLSHAVALPSPENVGRLRSAAGAYGLNVEDVPGDDNGMLRAIAIELNDPAQNDSSIRRLVARHMRDHIHLDDIIPENRQLLFDAISRGDDWANNMLIQATSRALNVNIVIVIGDGAAPTIMKQSNAARTICLGCHTGCRYQRLVGEPNGVLARLIEAAPVDYFENMFVIEPTRQRGHPIVSTLSVGTRLDPENPSLNR